MSTLKFLTGELHPELYKMAQAIYQERGRVRRDVDRQGEDDTYIRHKKRNIGCDDI